MDQLEIGTEVELEHRKLIETLIKKIKGSEPTEEEIKEVAAQIAKDHIAEDPEYYSKLKKMENGMNLSEEKYFGGLRMIENVSDAQKRSAKKFATYKGYDLYRFGHVGFDDVGYFAMKSGNVVAESKTQYDLTKEIDKL